MPRRLAAAAVALCAAALLTVPPAVMDAAAAPGDAPALSETLVAAAEDYATATHADPWDFANPEDVITSDGPLLNASSASIRDGMLKFTLAKTGHVSLVWPGYPGALFMGREGAAHPVDASRFTELSVRLYRSTPGAVALLWDNCMPEEGRPIHCHGAADQRGEAGWETYRFRLPAEADPKRERWAKDILALRLVIGASQRTNVLVDWVRLHAPGQEVAATWQSAEPSRLIWDRDDNATNNTDANRDWGTIGFGQGEGTATIPAGAWPAGRYRIYAVSRTDATRRLSSTRLLQVAEAPHIEFLNPDVTGGEDFAAGQTGDAWDFSESTDITEWHNIDDIAWAGGQLTATNAPLPDQNDPYVILRQDRPLDPRRYHRLTVKTTFAGQFSLEDAEGGGMHGRLSWQTQDMVEGRRDVPELWLQSRELVTYRYTDTYTVDLHTNPTSFLMETDLAPTDGWIRGGPVSTLRWDINEDRGPRRWSIDEIRLAADDEAQAGVFSVRWRDRNPATADGTRVRLYADDNARGFDGVLIGEAVQRHGEGELVWRTAGWAPGTYHVYALAVADGGRPGGPEATEPGVSRMYASGPLVIPGTDRAYGPDRARTAVAVSTAGHADAGTVVVAADHTAVDALGAGPLAIAAGGPLLLSGPDEVQAPTVAELQRLRPGRIVVAGGPAAVGEAALAQLRRAVPGATVMRAGGVDRFATAAALARDADTRWKGDTLILADHADVAVALSAAPLAAAAKAPLLLSDDGSLPAATLDALRELAPRRIIGVGAKVSEALLREAARVAGAATTRRVAGADAASTAALVADLAVTMGADGGRALVTGEERWADALAAGAAAGARNGVLLLTGSRGVPPATADWVRRHRPAMLVVGGPSAVPSWSVPGA